MAVQNKHSAKSQNLDGDAFNCIMAEYNAQLADTSAVAIGVSGGGDSMALAHLLQQWCSAHDKQLHILTVDHKLRPEAAEEAQQVKQWVENWANTEHFTLEWLHDNEKPCSRIQESARQARYDLMSKHCREHNIKGLFIGHHLNDQYETFLIRLTSGSGVKGLCAMPELSPKQNGVFKLRPLLNYSHEQILEYCTEHGVKWIEDPSNQDDHYKRVRVRNAHEFLSEEGLTAKRVGTLIRRLNRTKDALAHYTEQELQRITLAQSDVHFKLDFNLFKTLPQEIALNILGAVLSQIQGDLFDYPPNSEKLESLYARMSATDETFKGATLYKCQFKPKNKATELHISQES